MMRTLLPLLFCCTTAYANGLANVPLGDPEVDTPRAIRAQKRLVKAATAYMETLDQDNTVTIEAAVRVHHASPGTAIDKLLPFDIVLQIDSPACSYHFALKFFNRFLDKRAKDINEAHLAGFACTNSSSNLMWATQWGR